MSDPPRVEVVDAVAACRQAGIRIFMVTGDYGLTAEAIARRVGIVTAGPLRILSASDLDAMTDDELADVTESGQQLVFARVRPEHKMRIVGALEGRGEVVAVTGDGVNDAPALKRASIGVSMGEGGTDVARAASVMILLDDSFASIVEAVELGRAVFQNIRKFLIYLFSHNLAELAPILVAVFVGFPLVPLSALQVLSIDLGSDVLPALALGAEPPEPGIMSRRPRPPSEQLFNWAVVRRFAFLGTIQSCGVVFAFFWKIHSAHLAFSAFTSTNPTYREALTMTQAGIVVSQFFNSFAVRSDEESIFPDRRVLQPPPHRGRMHRHRLHGRGLLRSRSPVRVQHGAAQAERLARARLLGSAAPRLRRGSQVLAPLAKAPRAADPHGHARACRLVCRRVHKHRSRRQTASRAGRADAGKEA